MLIKIKTRDLLLQLIPFCSLSPMFFLNFYWIINGWSSRLLNTNLCHLPIILPYKTFLPGYIFTKIYRKAAKHINCTMVSNNGDKEINKFCLYTPTFISLFASFSYFVSTLSNGKSWSPFHFRVLKT